MANKPDIKKERTHGGKEEEKRKSENTAKNTFWKEREMSVSNETKAGDM